MTRVADANLDEKVAAELNIMDAARMTKIERRAIADWLKGQAEDLMTGGNRYARVVRAKYHVLRRGE